jgi:hypothetical protein
MAKSDLISRPQHLLTIREAAREMGKSRCYVEARAAQNLFTVTRVNGSNVALLDRRQLVALRYLRPVAPPEPNAGQVRRICAARDVAWAASIMALSEKPSLTSGERNLLLSIVAPPLPDATED